MARAAAWRGGWRRPGAWVGAAAILAVQLLLAALGLLDARLPIVLIGGLAVGAVALQYPLGAVALLVFGRILSTGSFSYLRIGGLNIGVFEPTLALAGAVLAARAVTRRVPLLHAFPWRIPFLVFGVWIFLGLSWCYALGSGIPQFVGWGVVFVTVTILLTFVREPEDFRFIAWAWVLSTAFVAVLSLTTNFTEVAGTGKTWEIAAGGGRETGLGQQPNWFSMNLMFGVLLSFALAMVERSQARRWLLMGMGFFIFLSQLRSGSRGGAYAIVIGSAIIASGNPVFRRWAVRFLLVGVLVAAGILVFGDTGADASAKAIWRIWNNLDTTWRTDTRERNWWVCIQMFLDTWGRGVGPGGYAQLIADYDWKIYDSIHKYPHGIFWGVLAQYGVVGVGALGFIVASVLRMHRRVLELARGTFAEPFTWVMLATMVGYWAWSFVEFNWDDKPFWEYLGLYTALYLMVERRAASGEGMPPLPAVGAILPWRKPGAAA